MLIKLLISETYRNLAKSILFVAILGIVCWLFSFWIKEFKLLQFLVSTAFGLTFIAAALTTSSIRHKRKIKVSTQDGAKTIGFTFIWGALVSVAFIATLHFWREMQVTLKDYALVAII